MNDMQELVRGLASKIAYEKIPGWKTKSPEFMQAMVGRLADTFRDSGLVRLIEAGERLKATQP